MELTFSYIKPAAVRRGESGAILKLVEESGFKFVALKKTKMTREIAESFYGEHKGKPFFDRLIEHSVSGPVVAMVLESKDAVLNFRKVIGATNPENADGGTIRAIHGDTLTANAIHGSDSIESAQKEMSHFFSKMERFW